MVALFWAKWLPYTAKILGLSARHEWAGGSILSAGGVQPGDRPSWQAATSFTLASGLAVWKALTAALLISAAIQALLPRRWLLRVMNRRTALGGAMVGGLVSTPSMMCT